MNKSKIYHEYSTLIHGKKISLNNITNRAMIVLSYLFQNYSKELKFKSYKTYFSLNDISKHMESFNVFDYSSTNLEDDLFIIEHTTLGESELDIVSSIYNQSEFNDRDKEISLQRSMNNDHTEWVIEFSRPTMEMVNIIIERFLLNY